MRRSSYCGVNCEKCKVYIGTLENDDRIRQEIADEWSILYKRGFKKEDLICTGCKSDTLFSLCSLCDIAPCNKERNIDNCEDCGVFPCDRIVKFFEYHKTNDTGNVFD